ncbi:Stk1 family PASTA domain-containing Ser/Thr kinase [Homoserinimonas sp. OAct 916]|uniref:Stk1 family PASTA domain-containing Ser/Thr kinase n=1 Tax=Homoserinimonas sp. OAct 916 TaxID=2211450 RepID=UPI000DBE3BC6|nr:Stk1 family PASTA domain-containing Ser/Thr kinase [Homoserinimonas sp. OAct 916]
MSEDGRLLADRYRVGELIGRGGMSDVYAGTDTRLGRTVAIKILKSSLAADPSFRTRFRLEAQAAARMAHPTIVRVFDAGEETVNDERGHEVQLPFIVMERVSGRLLKDVIGHGPLDPSEATRIMEGILTALEYSHRAGVVHRDIKPGNIMLTQSGQVKVMDFGIARAISDSSATVAQTTAILGTASYFSPEQAKGETVDARTDLYSAGVVLFEMLTGRVPFRGDTPVAIAYQHVSEPPVAPSTLNPRVSPALDQVVLHALDKDRFARFQSAAEFREDVVMAGSGIIPRRKVEEPGANLFGAPPTAASSSEQAIRQLAENQTVVRTQNRPPVIWIWAGVASVIIILAAVVFWVVSLSPSNLVSESTRDVPDFSGQTFDAAASTLEGLKLIPSRVDEESPTIPSGQVLRSEPPANSTVKVGEVIKLYVSLGTQKVEIPDLIGQSVDDAKKALLDANLTPGTVDMRNSPTVAPNKVLGTDPASGQAVDVGTTIKLHASNGMVKLQDLTGQSMAAATDILDSANLQLTAVPQPDPNCPAEPNTPVSHQSLAPGDVPQGSSVILQYCSG